MPRKLKMLISIGVILCMLLTSALTAFAIVSDVNGHWAEEVITRWFESGMAKGYSDGTFRPDDSATRAEFIALVNRAFMLVETVAIDYSDVKAGSFAYDEISKAQAAGYILGYEDGTFKPDKPVSRQEAAVMLSRLLKLSGPENQDVLMMFKDWVDIAVSSRAAVGACVDRGYFEGLPNKTFKPLNDITRAQAIVVLDRILRDIEKRRQETAAIGKISITNGVINIDLGDKSPVLSIEDFLVTAVLNGMDITLQNLVYDNSAKSFTFTPISRIGTTQYLTVTVVPAENCSKLSGSASANIIIDPFIPPTSPTQPILKAPPTINVDSSDNSVDNDLVLTFADGYDWAMAITSIKVDGIELSDMDPDQYQLVESRLTLKPSNTTLLQSPGSKTVTITATGYSTVSITQTVTAGEAVAENSIISTQPEGPAASGGLFEVQPVVTLKDRYGNICSTGPGATMNVSVSNNGSATWTLGGTTTVAAQAGIASFSGLTASNNTQTVIADALLLFTFGAESNTSTAFTVPAAEVSEQEFAAAEPDLAYGGDGGYLAVYESRRSDSVKLICGRLYDINGVPQGEEITISSGEYWCEYAAVAYDSDSGKYLVVWSDERSGKDPDINGQYVSADGQLIGEVFRVSTDLIGPDNVPMTNNQYKPDIIYDHFNDRFLVVWEDSVYGNRQTDIDGQFVLADGTLSGSRFPLVDQDWTQNSPSIAYDSINNVYLLSYANGTSGFHIFGQFINADGSLKGSNFYLLNPSTSADQSSPKLAFDTNRERFMLVWSDRVWVEEDDDYKYIIKGQFVKYDVNYTTNAALLLDGSNFNISDINDRSEEPGVVYDASRDDFLVTWQDNRNEADIDYGFNDIYIRFVSADGVPMGDADELVFSATGNQCNPDVAGSGNGRFLLVFESNETPVSVIIAVANEVVEEPV